MLLSTMLKKEVKQGVLERNLFNSENMGVQTSRAWPIILCPCYSRLTAILLDAAKPKVKMRHSWENPF